MLTKVGAKKGVVSVDWNYHERFMKWALKGPEGSVGQREGHGGWGGIEAKPGRRVGSGQGSRLGTVKPGCGRPWKT